MTNDDKNIFHVTEVPVSNHVHVQRVNSPEALYAVRVFDLAESAKPEMRYPGKTVAALTREALLELRDSIEEVLEQ